MPHPASRPARCPRARPPRLAPRPRGRRLAGADDALMTAWGDASVPPTPLSEHLNRSRIPGADEVGAIVAGVAQAGITIARELARAALVGRLGTTGTTNVQGETVKKLDVWANAVVGQ